ncbi:hypothetical protein ANABIO32_00890 [Rossellomorea marisflavi]|uniref:hypothetical protein n=1 Tax=Rossellomorea marisflavi TaxID=189381 RepID=UPI0025C7B026|nr:hypothetical protein [Rossellomorea marisflavi]GLI82403.1 hypothetical protein ANABIO32_00890 [Rossellomorea marisflavi]
MDKGELLEFASKYYDDLSHPLAVANQFTEMSDEWVVGLFHDVLEDNLDLPKDEYSILVYKLFKVLDYNWDAYNAIETLTRIMGEPYYEYIEFIKYMKDNNRQGGGVSLES